MTDEQQDETIDEKELPEAGNSDARIYPPVEEAGAGAEEEDEQQATHGDAAAVRDGAPEPADAE
jgi:hypothetical protein